MDNETLEIPAPAKDGRTRFLIRTLAFSLEILFVSSLVVWWLTTEKVRNGSNLWALFFYSFPSEFLISVIPHEPALLFFGKLYPPLTVSLVSIAGTLVTEVLNYLTFGYMADLKIFRKMVNSKTVCKSVSLFNKAPFAALWVAGFAPVPFYPFRFLVVVARYPLWKFVLAVFLSRTPRFYLLALAGHAIRFPNYLISAFFVLLVFATYFPALRTYLKNRNNDGRPGSSKQPRESPGF